MLSENKNEVLSITTRSLREQQSTELDKLNFEVVRNLGF